MRKKIVLLLCVIFCVNLLGVSPLAAKKARSRRDSLATARKKELAKKRKVEARRKKLARKKEKLAAKKRKKEETRKKKMAAKERKKEENNKNLKVEKETLESETQELSLEDKEDKRENIKKQGKAKRERERERERRLKLVGKKKADVLKKIKFEKTYVYKDAGFKENKYIPSGWMGDYGDLRLSTRSFVKPKKGMTCTKISYSARQSQGAGWAGIYWQYPANNWGVENKGLDLRGAKKLIFYIRGEKGGEIIDGLKIGGITGTYPDTADIPYGPIVLTKRWKKYVIDVRDYDMSHVIGGFAFVLTSEANPDGIIFYIDEIYFV